MKKIILKLKVIINSYKNIFLKLQILLNNKNIKSKLIYVYIFCVLVPTLVTNITIIGNSLKLSKEEQRENIDNIADSVAFNITRALDSAVYVTVDLYASDSIERFLDRKYETTMDYYQHYMSFFDNYIFYASSKHLISDITFYSDNPTMINGGRFFRVDTIKGEKWYKKFRQADKDLYVCANYYDTKYTDNRKRMLSIIRRLNYTGLRDTEKLVKLELNYNQVLENISSSAFDTTVYVCHNNKVIFTNSTMDKGYKSNFQDSAIIPEKEVQIHKAITTYGVDWDIYVTGYRSNYKQVFSRNLWIIVILFLADALIPAIMLALFSNSITKRILLLGKYLKKIKGENFELITGNKGKDEISELLDNYNLMAFRMKELVENELKSRLEQQELILARKQAELQALYSQINPHFLFNVLESIRMRSILKEEQETSKMIESLARLMRKSAEWGTDYITLNQELEFTKDYLELQKYRYGDGFQYKIKIEDNLSSYKIPSLVLVTFVENSCVHGFNRAGHYGTIFVSVYQNDNYFYIEIEDTGIGMESEPVSLLQEKLNKASISDLLQSDSLGMLNASIRLKKFCGEGTKIIIESELQEGTCITIKIPLKDMEI